VLAAPSILRGQSSPIVVAGQPVEIAVASISPSTVRITVLPIANASRTVPDDGALVAAAEGRSLVRTRETFAPINASELVVRFTANPPTLHIETPFGDAVQRLRLNADNGVLSFSLGKGPLLGLGEGGPQFDRKGSTFNNRNGQGGYQLRTHGGRVPIPWLLSTDGWGMFVHQPFGAFDLSGGKERSRLRGRAAARRLHGVNRSAGSHARVRADPGTCGAAAALGVRLHAVASLAGPEEISWVARTFREKKLPCDALIYLGTEFTPSGWNTRNGEFGWKAENFPNPKRAIDEMHAQHYKVVLHIVIEGRRMSGSVADECTPDKAVPSGRTPDDKWPDDRPVPCYWPYHKPLYDLGIDGMWPDQGDGLDQPSRMARIRMYWEGPQRYRPNDRPFALHRNGAPVCSTARSSGRAMSARSGRR
jgi:alpha-glucosidase/alpha-D-xyloside xylohydrolase